MKMYLPPKGEPPRRGFLKKGLFGGLLLAVGGGGWLFTRKGNTVALPEGIQNLSPAEYAVMWALVQRFVPTREGFPSADATQTGLACDRVIGLMEEVTRSEVKQLLMLFENALPNFLFGGRTVPFTMLDPTEQDRVIEEWRDSRLTLRRTGYSALRGLVMAAYYAQRAVWPALGYAGPLQGIHDPNAPVWKGGAEPRPFGNGSPPVEAAAPTPEPGPTPAVAPALDGGTP